MFFPLPRCLVFSVTMLVKSLKLKPSRLSCCRLALLVTTQGVPWRLSAVGCAPVCASSQSAPICRSSSITPSAGNIPEPIAKRHHSLSRVSGTKILALLVLARLVSKS